MKKLKIDENQLELKLFFDDEKPLCSNCEHCHITNNSFKRFFCNLFNKEYIYPDACPSHTRS